MEIESVFTQMAEEYGAEHVVYSHCHGKLRYADVSVACIMGSVTFGIRRLSEFYTGKDC